MINSTRCLYGSSFEEFNNKDDSLILGVLCDKYHGAALTTTREAWKDEIAIMKQALSPFQRKETGVLSSNMIFPVLANVLM